MFPMWPNRLLLEEVRHGAAAYSGSCQWAMKAEVGRTFNGVGENDLGKPDGTRAESSSHKSLFHNAGDHE